MHVTIKLFEENVIMMSSKECIELPRKFICLLLTLFILLEFEVLLASWGYFVVF